METAPRYEAAVAYVGCDGAGASAAIASKYSTKAAVHLCALYKQATEGSFPFMRPPPGLSELDFHIFKRWKALGHMLPICAKQLFVGILEMVDSEWIVKAYDLAVEPIIETVPNINVSESDARRNVEYKMAQDNWLRTIWAREIELSDCAGEDSRRKERAIEDSKRKDTRDYVQLAIEEDRKLAAGAIQQYKEARQKVNLDPASNSSIPSVGNILKPRQVDVNSLLKIGGIFLIEEYDRWIAPPVSGQQPKPRYQHGAFELDYKMCVAGGSNDGNGFDDIQVLDLMSLTWSKVDAGAENSGLSLPATPCSGQPLILWNNRLFAIAGHTVDNDYIAIAGHTVDNDYITVNELDKRCRTWSKLHTEGTIPIFRCGHSATIVGNNLVIFGGEDASGNVLNDLHILNLKTMRWADLEAIGTAPPRRSYHAAACHEDNIVFIFGGKFHDLYYNDLHKFDLKKCEWTRLDPEGVIPAARASHAGVTVDANWIIVGGRDCQTRFAETFVLNMGKVSWTFLTSRLPATEGMSLVASSYDGDDYIISFGGYDGSYSNEGSCSNEVRVLRLSSIYDKCEADPWPLSLSEEELETSIELEALVFERIKEQEALLSRRKEELEALVSKRKEDLKALALVLVPERKEERASPYMVEKELATLYKAETRKEVATPYKAETRKRKQSLLFEHGEADVSESAEKSCTPGNSESESTDKCCTPGNSESESTEKSCTSGSSES